MNGSKKNLENRHKPSHKIHNEILSGGNDCEHFEVWSSRKKSGLLESPFLEKRPFPPASGPQRPDPKSLDPDLRGAPPSWCSINISQGINRKRLTGTASRQQGANVSPGLWSPRASCGQSLTGNPLARENQFSEHQSQHHKAEFRRVDLETRHIL